MRSALPIAYVVLRILILLNWLGGAAILALLTATIVAEQWTFTALGITPESGIPSVIMGLRAIAAPCPLRDDAFEGQQLGVGDQRLAEPAHPVRRRLHREHDPSLQVLFGARDLLHRQFRNNGRNARLSLARVAEDRTRPRVAVLDVEHRIVA